MTDFYIVVERVQFACNAHTICDEEVRPLGTGLYPVISIINHRFAIGFSS